MQKMNHNLNTNQQHNFVVFVTNVQWISLIMFVHVIYRLIKQMMLMQSHVLLIRIHILVLNVHLNQQMKFDSMVNKYLTNKFHQHLQRRKKKQTIRRNKIKKRIRLDRRRLISILNAFSFSGLLTRCNA
jgi:hypothetical protein